MSSLTFLQNLKSSQGELRTCARTYCSCFKHASSNPAGHAGGRRLCWQNVEVLDVTASIVVIGRSVEMEATTLRPKTEAQDVMRSWALIGFDRIDHPP
jgi:hypothetical protein